MNVETDITVSLRSRRRQWAQLAQKSRDVIPAFGLLIAGVESLRAGARGAELVFASVCIGISGLFGVSLIRRVRGARGQHTAPVHHEHGVDWTDIWVAGVLFTEAAETWHVRHHIARPVILTGVVTLALGVFHGRLAAMGERRRSLRLTGERLIVGGRPFRTFSARWNEIKDIRMEKHEAIIHTHQGRQRRLDFLDLENAADVRQALETARRRLIPAEAKAITADDILT